MATAAAPHPSKTTQGTENGPEILGEGHLSYQDSCPRQREKRYRQSFAYPTSAAMLANCSHQILLPAHDTIPGCVSGTISEFAAMRLTTHFHEAHRPRRIRSGGPCRPYADLVATTLVEIAPDSSSSERTLRPTVA
jgi:hypothetical protein